MTKFSFQAGGPLPSNSQIYVERKADRDVLRYLRGMNYVQLTEPRQVGKTSLIYRLLNCLRKSSHILAYVDAESLKSKTEAGWYRDMSARLVEQLRSSVKCENVPIPTDATTWRSFLSDLATSELYAADSRPGLIIAIDEIGNIPLDWAEDFFRVLREVYVVREVEPKFRFLTFFLVGAFDPRDLISDSKISPFNVAQRVELKDFSVEQVGQLVANLGLSADRSAVVTERIHFWTSGQPYLTQKLCVYLAEQEYTIDADSVDASVDRFFREDTNHLPRIIKDLKDDVDLIDYARQIMAEQAKFTPSINSLHFKLAHVIGVMTYNQRGRCQVRNRIYERAIEEVDMPFEPLLAPDSTPRREFHYDAFISYSSKDRAWVCDILLPHLEGEDLRVCIDYRDFEVGAPSLVNMENAIEHSRKTLVILTPNWIASEWTEFEALLIQTKDPAGRGRRIVPLMVQPCSPPERLQVFTYVDLSDPSEFDFQLQRLVAAIRSTPAQILASKRSSVQTSIPSAHPVMQDFSHARGLGALGSSLKHTSVEIRMGFAVLESRLLENLQDERRYGISETLRSERARIIRELNRLALIHLDCSFNDLCQE